MIKPTYHTKAPQANDVNAEQHRQSKKLARKMTPSATDTVCEWRAAGRVWEEMIVLQVNVSEES
jgi:hypothetical protein